MTLRQKNASYAKSHEHSGSSIQVSGFWNPSVSNDPHRRHLPLSSRDSESFDELP